MANKNPPGMIIYATLFPMFERMSLEQVGQLVMGMCEYFTTGLEPALPAELAISWPLVQDQIDRNVAAYNKKTAENDLKGAYSQYARKAKDDGETPLPYARWKDASAGCAEEERDASVSVRDASVSVRDGSVSLCNRSVDEPIKTKQNQTKTETITKPNITEVKTEAITKPNAAEASPAGAAGMPPSLDEVRAYCAENNLPVSAEEFFYHYAGVGWRIGKTPMQDWKAVVRKWALQQPQPPSVSPASPVPAEKKNSGPTREDLERLKRLRDKIRSEGTSAAVP